MKFIRRSARRLYSGSLSLLLQAGIGPVAILSPSLLRQRLGDADVLRIAAPGASVRASDRVFSQDDHVLAVNYFSECTDLHLWRQRIAFVIEPHPTYKRYAESIRRAAAEKSECFVIVKGFGSPRKIRSALRLIRELSAIPGVTVLLSDDLYIADLSFPSYAEAVVRHENHTISGSKTLLWTLSFAYVAGYRKIVLHGFDFSDAYAYDQRAPGTSERVEANTWVNDAALRAATLKEVVDIAELFRTRGVELLQCSCEGPIGKLLPADPACVQP